MIGKNQDTRRKVVQMTLAFYLGSSFFRFCRKRI